MWRCVVAAALVCGGCDLIFVLEDPKSGVADAPDLPSDGTITPPDGLVCPPQYLPRASLSTRYRASTQQRMWKDAEADCESDGGHLVVPSTIAELDPLLDMQSPRARVWVGIARNPGTTTNDFRTITNKAFPKGTPFFEAGEPSGGTGDLTLEIVNTHPAMNGLNDIPFAFSNHYVCECDLAPITPFTF